MEPVKQGILSPETLHIRSPPLESCHVIYEMAPAVLKFLRIIVEVTVLCEGKKETLRQPGSENQETRLEPNLFPRLNFGGAEHAPASTARSLLIQCDVGSTFSGEEKLECVTNLFVRGRNFAVRPHSGPSLREELQR